jgi:hypothetical protein
MHNWRACQEWIDANGNANFFKLAELFPDAQVQVAMCNIKQFNDQCRTMMSVKQFAEKITQSDDLLYLKDWHLMKEFPDYHPYQLPVYFSDDWINAFWDASPQRDDYRFVYAGKKGTFTPLHCDVFHSYSWSANVVGEKLW